jgi:hypothetical protein
MYKAIVYNCMKISKIVATLKILCVIFVFMAVYFRRCQGSIVVMLHTTQIKIATTQPEVKLR